MQPSPICCSLCSPNYHLFRWLPPLDVTPLRPAAPRASQVDTRYTMSELDLKFRAALHSFRREQTVKLYGLAHLKNLGPGAIMGDETLKRIVDCARAHKIRCLESLARETKWNRTSELGEHVLCLIAEYVSSLLPLLLLIPSLQILPPTRAARTRDGSSR